MSSPPSPLASALDPADWTRGPIADIFSSYIAAAALSAAHELGLLETLAAHGDALIGGDDIEGLDAAVVRQLYTVLSWAKIVEISGDDAVVPGPLFDEAYAARGYFYWLVRGCGQVFTDAPSLAHRQRRTGNFFERDMRAVAIGSWLIGDAEVEGLFDQIIAGLPVRKVADFGCGSASRLIRIAGNNDAVECVGIDISADAVRLATDNVAAAGLTGRIAIRHADVRQLEPIASHADIDTLTCVFMGHDFWPYGDCVRTLRRLHAAFPAASRLLLCDVVRAPETSRDMTIFTLGFESVHALMGVYIPTLAEWQQAFAASGWECEVVHPVTAPPNGVLFELAPTAGASHDGAPAPARPGPGTGNRRP
jgi:phenylpyruvate C(3)-methyltransferase